MPRALHFRLFRQLRRLVAVVDKSELGHYRSFCLFLLNTTFGLDLILSAQTLLRSYLFTLHCKNCKYFLRNMTDLATHWNVSFFTTDGVVGANRRALILLNQPFSKALISRLWPNGMKSNHNCRTTTIDSTSRFSTSSLVEGMRGRRS